MFLHARQGVIYKGGAGHYTDPTGRMVPLDGLPASFPHLSILFHYGTPPLTSLVFHITKSPTLNANTKWLLSAPTGTQGEPRTRNVGKRHAQDRDRVPSKPDLQGLRQGEWQPGSCCRLLSPQRQLLARPSTAVAGDRKSCERCRRERKHSWASSKRRNDGLGGGHVPYMATRSAENL